MQHIPVPDMTAAYPPGTNGQQWAPMPGGPGTVGVQPGKRRSPVVPIVAGAAAVAAIAAAAAFFLWPRDGSAPDPDPTGNPVAQQSGKQNPPNPQQTTSSPTQNPTASAPPSTPRLPPGFRWVRGGNYRIAIPNRWQQTSRSSRGIVWSDPVTKAYVQVDPTPWTGDPYDHWVQWEKEAIADGNLKNFQRQGPVTRTSVAGRPAADIEFTWSRSVGGTHAIDRGVIVNDTPYAVVVAVPSSQWNENEQLVKNVLNTFQPSGVG
jgi:hypothetical protein